MKERGEYRAIYCALIDDYDFVRLPPEAKAVFFTLKLLLGSSGIGVVYRSQLCEIVGIPSECYSDTIRMLSEYHWIETEGNIFWIVNGLKHDPTMNWKNPNHVKGVVNQVIRLPRVPIVWKYIEKYRLIELVPDKQEILREYHSNGIGIVSEYHSDGWDKDKDKDKVSEDRGVGKETAFAFVPPAVEDVVAFGEGMLNLSEEKCREFHLYYEARGWKSKGSEVRNWKALLQSWKNNEYKFKEKDNGSTAAKSGKRVFRCPDEDSDREMRDILHSASGSDA